MPIGARHAPERSIAGDAAQTAAAREPLEHLTAAESDVLEAIAHDKKVVAGQLHYVLPTAIGKCEVVADVTKDEIAQALGSVIRSRAL